MHTSQLFHSSLRESVHPTPYLHFPLQECRGNLDQTLQESPWDVTSLSGLPNPFPGFMGLPIVGKVVQIHSLKVIGRLQPVGRVKSGRWNFGFTVRVSRRMATRMRSYSRNVSVGGKRLRRKAHTRSAERLGLFHNQRVNWPRTWAIYVTTGTCPLFGPENPDFDPIYLPPDPPPSEGNRCSESLSRSGVAALAVRERMYW